jgi:hypothetical protein
VTEFIQLHEVIDGHIAHMVNQMQMYPYISMGAAGCWSITAWQGPWPVIRLYQACAEGDIETAKRIQREMRGDGGGDDLRAQLPDVQGGNVQEYAGYIVPGAQRPPFSLGPQDPTHERAKAAAEKWKALCEKYRPEVEARRKAPALV